MQVGKVLTHTMKPVYTATVTSVGGRHGRVQSSDGALKVELMPPSATVQHPTRTNPEQLFAAGYAACFASAVELVARARKLVHGLITVIGKVDLAEGETGFQLGIALDVTIAELDQSEAEALVEEAHKVCPYSKATRGNVEVKLMAHGSK